MTHDVFFQSTSLQKLIVFFPGFIAETENQPCDECSTPLEEERGVEVHSLFFFTCYRIVGL